MTTIIEAKEVSTFGWFDVAARIKQPDIVGGRVCCALEVMSISGGPIKSRADMSNTTKVTYMLTDGWISKGKNKGATKWVKGSAVVVYVTRDEANGAREQWGRETGKCTECCGDGRVSRGWSQAEGSLWKQCPMCSKGES